MVQSNIVTAQEAGLHSQLSHLSPRGRSWRQRTTPLRFPHCCLGEKKRRHPKDLGHISCSPQTCPCTRIQREYLKRRCIKSKKKTQKADQDSSRYKDTYAHCILARKGLPVLTPSREALVPVLIFKYTSQRLKA